MAQPATGVDHFSTWSISQPNFVTNCTPGSHNGFQIKNSLWFLVVKLQSKNYHTHLSDINITQSHQFQLIYPKLQILKKKTLKLMTCKKWNLFLAKERPFLSTCTVFILQNMVILLAKQNALRDTSCPLMCFCCNFCLVRRFWKFWGNESSANFHSLTLTERFCPLTVLIVSDVTSKISVQLNLWWDMLVISADRC